MRRAHDITSREKRGDVLISRAMPVSSRRLGVSGECDVVEFHRAEKGISLHGYDGVFQVIPIEYKRGKPKAEHVDLLQLTAQACAWKRCCAVKSLSDICITGKSDAGKEWIFPQIFEKRLRRCSGKCTAILTGVIPPE